MELLLKNISKHVELTKIEKEKLLSVFETTRYPAKTRLVQAGEVCADSYFLLSGIIRSFTIDDNLVEHTLSFAKQDWWISDMYSFLSEKPGNLYIEVVEDAIVTTLSRRKQLEIFDEIPKMERYFRILIENSLIANQQRLIDNMSLTAEERYEEFCRRFPDIKYSLPQKQIASYLGITPEFFSKMKSKLLRNK